MGGDSLAKDLMDFLGSGWAHLIRLYGFLCRMRSSLFQKLVLGVALLAGIEIVLLEVFLSGPPGELRWRIVETTVPVALLAAAAGFVFSRRLTRRMARLRVSVASLGTGPAQIPRPESADELGALAEALGRAAAQVNELVDKVRLEGARRDAILTGMVEGVLAVDQELRVTFCNAAFASAFGVRGPAPAGLPVLRLVRDPDFLTMLRTVVASGQVLKQRMHLTGADGRSFEVQAAPLAGASSSGAMAILHDITDLERLERVRKDFVANVSHELRTPLTAIRGYAETLLDGALDDPEHRRRFVEIIQSHAIRLNNIASDLLALSELESGRPPVEPGKLSVVATLEAAMRTVESEAEMRQVHLSWGTVEDLEVMGNRIKLEQAFVNLLDNAVKFNRKGGEVWLEARRVPGGKVAITIADSGIGIPSEDLPRIFERFYRVDKARSREVGGTGLGLSIVKHVVEQMNGTVSVDSQLGKGSRFSVLLPEA
ncbi:MAG: ATP-binding protein [Bryobacteraceae bacterium]|jgi:two-component system phosphate regulon sensor histidine kinase PhoR